MKPLFLPIERHYKFKGETDARPSGAETVRTSGPPQRRTVVAYAYDDRLETEEEVSTNKFTGKTAHT